MAQRFNLGAHKGLFSGASPVASREPRGTSRHSLPCAMDSESMADHAGSQLPQLPQARQRRLRQRRGLLLSSPTESSDPLHSLNPMVAISARFRVLHRKGCSLRQLRPQKFWLSLVSRRKTTDRIGLWKRQQPQTYHQQTRALHSAASWPH